MLHRWGRLSMAVLAFFLSVAAPRKTRAAGEDPESRLFALHWVRLAGAEDCVDGIALSRMVEARAGRRLFVTSEQADWLVEGAVRARGEGFFAELRLFSANGELIGSRQVATESDACAELTEDLALILAIMVDASGAPPPNPLPAPEAPVPAERETSSPAEGESEAEKADSPADSAADQQLVAFARAAVGATPQPAAGVGAAYLLSTDDWGALRAEAAVFLPQRIEVENAAGAHVRWLLAYGGLAYCPLLGRDRLLQWTGCAGLVAGTLSSRSKGLVTPQRRRNEFMAMVDLAIAASLQLAGPLTVQTRAGLLIPLIRRDYEVTLPEQTTTRALYGQRLAGVFDLGLGIAF